MEYDNNIAKSIDPEAAEIMKREGYDIKFLWPWDPAFRDSETGVWSCCVWDSGPAGTILAMDFDTLVERVEEFKKYREAKELEKWEKDIYLPQRAEVVFTAGLDVNDKDELDNYRPE